MKRERPINGKVRRAGLASDHVALRLAISSIRDLNQIDETSMTPLLYAVYRGDVEFLQHTAGSRCRPQFQSNAKRSHTHIPLWHAEHDFGLNEIAALL
jgi:hypothetical protein